MFRFAAVLERTHLEDHSNESREAFKVRPIHPSYRAVMDLIGSDGSDGSHGRGGQDTSDATPCPVREEMRLALVLNGGISLAVWMGGVVHELDLLRRASRGDDIATVDPADQQAFKIWRDLANDAGKRVVIDVIAGTSAGGLNGMLLATAIGRGAALPPLGRFLRII